MTYEEALARFLKMVTELSDNYHRKHSYPYPPVFSVISGKKYDRVIATATQRMAYAWIDRSNGNILKGSWKKVEDKRPRGNIFDENPIAHCNAYGTDYLNSDCSQYK